jgi:hypothetical protein
LRECVARLDESRGVELLVLDEINHGRSEIVTSSAAGRRIFGLGDGRNEAAGAHDHRKGVAIKRGVVGVGVKERDESLIASRHGFSPERATNLAAND